MSSERPHRFGYPPRTRTKEEAEARARAIAEAQGTLSTSTFENLVGKGKNLWPTDEEFEQFLEFVREIRREGREED